MSDSETDLIRNQKHNLPLLVTPELCAGRTYIVTGANTGLGFEAAKHLAKVGAAKVILAVRNQAAGEQAKRDIDEAAGAAGSSSVVEVWQLDLASYDSVRAFARRAAAELDRIDALIENAGVALGAREMAEGHIKSVTVNVISTFLLAVLLLPEMRKKAKLVADCQPRIVIVASRVGFIQPMELWEKIKDDPIKGMDAEDFVPFRTYPFSKLTEIFAGRHLAREVVPFEKTGIILNLVCPGFCVTNLARNAPPNIKQGIREQHEKYGRTADDGSRPILHGAVAGVESHGKLLHSCEDGEPDVPDWVKNDLEQQKRVWELVAKELEAVEPGSVSRLQEVA
ncbi:uncharacterized protein THITE_2059810 [Thermothielavioides terrestris NRRL 8126]|uniref:Uncharacterized protein n=1 Tax=Thermothielavioides terrestris (strain ATCC 38088 / NRRL 8126) TaxID=578455 RepID=G2RG75_THETT|nr:uncharacterized protein THITE_2059810 [Thermothielavioides terrestris NRRL 8126]AEO71818.1 hypothetical protein THITE_2059810 [Thermothielavioides terrestris NRRL 8126]